MQKCPPNSSDGSRFGDGSGPHFLCWISGVVPFNTWLISSWEENKCCYKLSNWQNDNNFYLKWQLRHHFEFHPPKVSSTPSHLMLISWFWVLSARPWAIWSVLSVSLEVVDQTKGTHICLGLVYPKFPPKSPFYPFYFFTSHIWTLCLEKYGHTMLRLDATPKKRCLGFDFKFKKFSIK